MNAGGVHKKHSSSVGLRSVDGTVHDQIDEEENEGQEPIKPELKTIGEDNETPAGLIKIEINKEDSIVDYLTKDHKANMSLLFYDFNNTNQRMHTKK
jgi:hypothetical protein